MDEYLRFEVTSGGEVVWYVRDLAVFSEFSNTESISEVARASLRRASVESAGECFRAECGPV